MKSYLCSWQAHLSILHYLSIDENLTRQEEILGYMSTSHDVDTQMYLLLSFHFRYLLGQGKLGLKYYIVKTNGCLLLPLHLKSGPNHWATFFRLSRHFDIESP